MAGRPPLRPGQRSVRQLPAAHAGRPTPDAALCQARTTTGATAGAVSPATAGGPGALRHNRGVPHTRGAHVQPMPRVSLRRAALLYVAARGTRGDPVPCRHQGAVCDAAGPAQTHPGSQEVGIGGHAGVACAAQPIAMAGQEPRNGWSELPGKRGQQPASADDACDAAAADGPLARRRCPQPPAPTRKRPRAAEVQAEDSNEDGNDNATRETNKGTDTAAVNRGGGTAAPAPSPPPPASGDQPQLPPHPPQREQERAAAAAAAARRQLPRATGGMGARAPRVVGPERTAAPRHRTPEAPGFARQSPYPPPPTQQGRSAAERHPPHTRRPGRPRHPGRAWEGHEGGNLTAQARPASAPCTQRPGRVGRRRRLPTHSDPVCTAQWTLKEKIFGLGENGNIFALGATCTC